MPFLFYGWIAQKQAEEISRRLVLLAGWLVLHGKIQNWDFEPLLKGWEAKHWKDRDCLSYSQKQKLTGKRPGTPSFKNLYLKPHIKETLLRNLITWSKQMTKCRTYTRNFNFTIREMSADTRSLKRNILSIQELWICALNFSPKLSTIAAGSVFQFQYGGFLNCFNHPRTWAINSVQSKASVHLYHLISTLNGNGSGTSEILCTIEFNADDWNKLIRQTEITGTTLRLDIHDIQ